MPDTAIHGGTVEFNVGNREAVVRFVSEVGKFENTAVTMDWAAGNFASGAAASAAGTGVTNAGAPVLQHQAQTLLPTREEPNLISAAMRRPSVGGVAQSPNMGIIGSPPLTSMNLGNNVGAGMSPVCLMSGRLNL